MEEPTISKLADDALANAFGGGMTKNALNQLTYTQRALKDAAGVLSSPAHKAIRRTNDLIPKMASTSVLSTFKVDPVGLGKALCPSAGQPAPNNRVNSTKLRSRKTDNIEPSQTRYLYRSGRCNA